MKAISQKLLVLGGVIVLVLASVGTVIAVKILRSSPPPLTLSSATATARVTVTSTPGDPLAAVCGKPSPASGQGVSGVWVVQSGGVAGYRAHEKWANVTTPHEAVARTQRVAGWAMVTQEAGITLEGACFAVELATLTSEDQVPGQNMPDRDENVKDFLGTRAHPFAVFRANGATLIIGRPNGSRAHVSVKGQLEINGKSRPATLSVDVALAGDQLNLAGSTVVVATDYGLTLPTVADFVAVDPHITVEFSVSTHRTNPAP